MRCPTLTELPPPPPGKTGWPWTEESEQRPDTTPQGTPWPKVSIVTPSYNQGRFLEESIRSVLLQGYPDLEYIIIDAGSSDESVEIIKKYERWLAYWISEPDRGQSHAINKGLEKSTGQFFNWHNGDDLLNRNSLATTAAVIVLHPNVCYVHGNLIVIDNDSQMLYETNPDFWKNMTFVPDLVWSIAMLKGGMQIGCLMRRDLVIEVGGIDEQLHYVMDRDIILRLHLTQYPALYVEYPVVFWREHPEAKTLNWNAERAKERLIIARKIFESPALPPSAQAEKHTVFATAHRFAWECYAKAGRRTLAVWHAVLDICYLPWDGWNERKRLVKSLERQYHSRWLKFLRIIINKIDSLCAQFRSSGEL